MRIELSWPMSALLASMALASVAPTAAAQYPLTLSASDGGVVHGHVFSTEGDARGIVLAFHQGGASGLGEYAPIAPRLTELGLEVLAVDQRNGGAIFGGENRTLALYEEEPGFCDAYPDVLGALEWARERAAGRPIVIWGSSYSGALALRLAAESPEGVGGVLVFSPASGVDCPGEAYSSAIEVPVLALRPAAEMERESSQRQAEVLREQGHGFFVARPGAHGSSMLVEERVGAPVDDTWTRVRAFLERVAGEG